MSLLGAFDKSIGKKEKPKNIPICEFAEKWCNIYPLVSQRVMLKLYSGEKLSDEPAYDQDGKRHEVSEQEWFDIMYNRGYFPKGIKEAVEEGKQFQDILLVVGRRGGKSTMIAVAALYSVYKLLQHENPQRYYSMQEGSVIEISVAAKTGKQAEKAPYAKIRQICEAAIVQNLPLAEFIEDIHAQTIFFLTKSDRIRKQELFRRNIRKYQNHGTVRIEAYNSNTDSFRGGSVIAAIMDEFAQYQIHKQTGDDAAQYFYDTLVPSVHQFKEDGKVFILSTPQGKVGKFWELYEQVFHGEDEEVSTIGMKMPSWEAWYGMPPSMSKVTLQSLADDNRVPFKWDYRGRRTEDGKPEELDKALAKAPSAFKREYAAEFQGAEDQWIPEILIWNPQNPEESFRQPQLERQTQGVMGRLYVAHADPARNHDGFAFAIGHKETHPKRGEEVIIDYAYRWIVQPNEHYQSPGEEYEKVIKPVGAEPAHVKFREIREWLERNILLRFDVNLLTMDQWNSQLMIEDLVYYIYNKQLQTLVKEENFNSTFNKTKDDNFQQLLLEHRIHCYYQPVLEREMTNLYKDKFGRVQAMPGEHDDLYDCISVVALKAMELPEFQDVNKQGSPFNVMPVFVEQRM
jgi:hypothetical protein